MLVSTPESGQVSRGLTDIAVENTDGGFQRITEVLLRNSVLLHETAERGLVHLHPTPAQALSQSAPAVGQREPEDVFANAGQDANDCLERFSLDTIEPLWIIPEPRNGASLKSSKERNVRHQKSGVRGDP